VRGRGRGQCIRACHNADIKPEFREPVGEPRQDDRVAGVHRHYRAADDDPHLPDTDADHRQPDADHGQPDADTDADQRQPDTDTDTDTDDRITDTNTNTNTNTNDRITDTDTDTDTDDAHYQWRNEYSAGHVRVIGTPLSSVSTGTGVVMAIAPLLPTSGTAH
jgi:hypothetical protein